MAKETGYIKLYRSILDWEWYQDIPTKIVFLHLLLSANYEDKKWKGITVHRGETATSYGKIAEKTGLSYQQARNAVSKLKSTGNITQQTTNRYSLIHIENFEMYQGEKTDLETGLQQSDAAKSDSQSTTTKEIKNKEDIKEVGIKEKNIKKESFSIPPEIAEAFAEYLKMRNRIKKPATERAQRDAIAKLERLAPHDYEMQNKILDQSIFNCYVGVFPLKDENGGGRYGQAHGQSDRRMADNGASGDTMSTVVY